MKAQKPHIARLYKNKRSGHFVPIFYFEYGSDYARTSVIFFIDSTSYYLITQTVANFKAKHGRCRHIHGRV